MSKNLKVSQLLDYYGGVLTKKQRDLAQFYYNDDLSLAEISELTHITRQGVHDSIKRTEVYLTELESTIGYCKNATETIKMLESILKLATEIFEINDENKYSYEIGEKAAGIQYMIEQYMK